MMQLASPRPASTAPDAIPQNTRKIPASEADYVGVGIVFDAQMRVLNLVKGGAAERSGGILRYDHLVAVDGRSMMAASTEQLKVAVRGPPGLSLLLPCAPPPSIHTAAGTSVVLTFKRNEQSASFDVPLVRSGLAAAPVSPGTEPGSTSGNRSQGVASHKLRSEVKRTADSPSKFKLHLCSGYKMSLSD